MEKQYYFIIYAYDQRLENGNFLNSTTVEVLDINLDSALERVKKLITKPFYYVSSIVEKSDEHKKHEP